MFCKQLLPAITLAALSMQASALDILITNDDGYDASFPVFNEQGIPVGEVKFLETMYEALTAAGHNVTMVAPRDNQSGKGMSFNSNITYNPATSGVELVNFDSNKWYLEGTPVDTVNAGLDIVLAGNTPDLVISGPNFGQNVGPIASKSGTVGAAQQALQRGIPAIAVSVLRPSSRDVAQIAATAAAMDDAAAFVVKVVDELTVPEDVELPWFCGFAPQAEECNPVIGALSLPEGVGLNINYPNKEATDVAGVSYTRISTYTSINFSFSAVYPGIVMPVISPNLVPPTEKEQQEDELMLNAGFITISPLDPDLNANIFENLTVGAKLKNLQP